MDETFSLMILGLVIGWIGHSVIASHIRRAHEQRVIDELLEKLEEFANDEPLEPGVNVIRLDKRHWANN